MLTASFEELVADSSTFEDVSSLPDVEASEVTVDSMILERLLEVYTLDEDELVTGVQPTRVITRRERNKEKNFFMLITPNDMYIARICLFAVYHQILEFYVEYRRRECGITRFFRQNLRKRITSIFVRCI